MNTKKSLSRFGVSALAAAMLVGVAGCASAPATSVVYHVGEWRSTGGDAAFTRYSPLAQISRDNVKNLKVLWRAPALDPVLQDEYPRMRMGNNLRTTPTMKDGVLYAQDLAGLAVALDPLTGKRLWRQDLPPEAAKETSASNVRGVELWGSGAERRVLTIRNNYLYALDPATGKPVAGFGTDGRILLTLAGARSYVATSGPTLVGDVIVLGGTADGAGDSGFKWKGSVKEDVRGFDARTGKLLWTFHVVPRAGEPGTETWGNDSWKESGDLGSWCCISADEKLGYVYIPLSGATAAYYGGHRPGDNLYASSLLALDAKTGKLVWHFQTVHHDLWDFDLVGAPALGDITVDGKKIKAVMQPSKVGFLYTFDRVTGKPVWPIVERPVPQSQVPGEHTSPTQPFPTKPAPFTRQGVTEDDLVDFTPELRAKAKELTRDFEFGALFAPASVISNEPGGKKGTIVMPGSWGAGNWNTGAFDPETGYYYAFAHEIPRVYRVEKSTQPGSEMEYWSPSREAPYIDGWLPVFKPPYGQLTAIDMNTGEHVWSVANGDGPKDYPGLADLNLPKLGVASRPVALVTKTLLFIGDGSDVFGGVNDKAWSRKFRAYDKKTGEVVWETELPSGQTGGPMTYLIDGKQVIVVPVGSSQEPGEWVALALQ